MSQYLQQDLIEEDGIKVLTPLLESNFFLVNDWAKMVWKDKYPDIDWQIRLRDGEWNYLNKYLHYQTKSHKQIKNLKKYYIEEKIIIYLAETNVPTLIFIVDTSLKKCYWYYIEKTKLLNMMLKKTGPSVDISENEINGNCLELKNLWAKIAQNDNDKEMSSKLDIITSKFNLNIKACLGILYLFNAVQKTKLPQEFSKLLNIAESESLTIISYLEQEKVISSTANYYLLENEKLWVESLFFLLESELLNFNNLAIIFNESDKKTIFNQLAKVKHQKIQEYFNGLVDEFEKKIWSLSTNEDIFINLELLEKYIHTVPTKAISILAHIINSKRQLKSVRNSVKGFWEREWMSHEELIEKSIDLLEKLRYVSSKKVFLLLLKLVKNSKKAIKEKAIKSLKKIAEYNLYTLKVIGYQAQFILLDEIEKLDELSATSNTDAILALLEEILDCSYEGTEMKDYKTFTFHRGALVGSKNLEVIRNRALEILKKLYRNSKGTTVKKRILEVMGKATHPPIDSYEKSLEDIIVKNTKNIVSFYIEVVKSGKSEIINEIEEQVFYMEERRRRPLKYSKELKFLIAQNKDYWIHKTFIGYSHNFTKSDNRKTAEEERKSRVEEFIKQICEENFNEREERILKIMLNQDFNDIGVYHYFNYFLFEVGKQKPLIAQRLIGSNENHFWIFLSPIITGILNSSKKTIAISYINSRISQWKFLPIIADTLTYIGRIDENILKLLLTKSKQLWDTLSLKKAIHWIAQNTSEKDIDYKDEFTESIKELTKYKDYWRVQNVWHQPNSILNSLNKNQVSIVLDNLLRCPRIDYEIENILTTIANRFPRLIISFFEKRIEMQMKEKRWYDALPYELHYLQKALLDQKEIVIEAIFKRFHKKGRLYQRDWGSLLKSIFPLEQLDEKLTSLLMTWKETNIDIVMSVLSKFQWHLTLDSEAIITLIKKHPNHNDTLISLFSATWGIVGGEYGFVNSLLSKKEALNERKKSKKKYLQKFMKQYEENLSLQIEYEKKRADENLALRKHEYR